MALAAGNDINRDDVVEAVEQASAGRIQPNERANLASERRSFCRYDRNPQPVVDHASPECTHCDSRQAAVAAHQTQTTPPRENDQA